LQLTN